MAKIGLSNLHYAIMTSGSEDTPTSNPVYGNVKTPNAPMVQADLSVNIAEAKLYGDNKLVASAREFQSGEISLEITDLPMEMAADLLGNTYDSSAKTLIKKSSDNPPYVAIAGEFDMDGGGKLAFWLYKVKFGEGNQTGQTKGESTSFQTNTITGTFTALKGAGDNTNRWQYNKEFASTDSTTSFYSSVPLAAVSP